MCGEPKCSNRNKWPQIFPGGICVMFQTLIQSSEDYIILCKMVINVCQESSKNSNIVLPVETQWRQHLCDRVNHPWKLGMEVLCTFDRKILY